MYIVSQTPELLEFEKVVRISDKYQCTICGYIYEPSIGDADSGIAPGTPFKELPDDWICPQCGAMKNEFKAV